MLKPSATEQTNPQSFGIDSLETKRILEMMNEFDSSVPISIEPEIAQITKGVECIVEGIDNGGRLFFLGAGTSGRLGVLESSECPPTFGVPPEYVQAIMAGGERAVFSAMEIAEDDASSGAKDLDQRGFSKKDVLVGVSASGESLYVIGAVRHARAIGAATIGVSCNRGSSLSREVDIPITPMTGAEIITGSTRLKAATATKLVLNMLTTVSMIRLGHVFGNLMVNAHPSNQKLRERACRTIVAATDSDAAQASELLQAAGDSVKTAIVMARLGLSREEAELRIAAAKGRIQDVID
jgi:N-acetylmuramic acid 6-phosphate etherase